MLHGMNKLQGIVEESRDICRIKMHDNQLPTNIGAKVQVTCSYRQL